ncbi:uncharacterized protein LOC117553517 [Gymnodraco acuticeps]|uniref:Uncharacterized protein LOC117553517 n=1 Tax=Gymnodraco acuticeps TaxID=8218 RepID=A0A6P8UZN4_GYMAC|nr:uncharacterized protein LOC117553517 [Gymnodraco acuticeps]
MRGLAEPLIPVTVLDKQLPFLVDSGARYSTLKDPKYQSQASHNTVAVVGFSGQIEQLPLTHKLPSSIAGQTFQHPYLLSPQCPANLLGRDILIKANASILCSPDGLKVTFPNGAFYNCSATISSHSQMLLAQSCSPAAFQETTIYWGLLTRPLEEAKARDSLYGKFSLWKPWIQAIHPYSPPKDPPHVTFFYSRSPFDETFAEEWDDKKYDQTDGVCTGKIFISEVGVAAEVFLDLDQDYWYRMGPESVPHITLLLGPASEARSLGPFVKKAQTATDWIPTDIPQVEYSPSLKAHAISHSSEEGINYEEVPVVRDHHMDKQDHPDTQSMFDKLPGHLWSKDPYDVGHCILAEPVRFQYTADPLVYAPQYPMAQAAKEGIDETIDGLIRSGVLEDSTDLQWNTPILPVKKAGAARAKGHTEEAEGSRDAEYVRLKTIKPKWCAPRFSEPLKVTQRTDHAVRVDGKGDTWYHWSRCVEAPAPTRTLADTIQDLGQLNIRQTTEAPQPPSVDIDSSSEEEETTGEPMAAQEITAGEEAQQGTAPPK